VERIAEGLQGLGALAVAVGLFAALAWPVALLVLGGIAVAVGIILEVGTRPRQVHAGHVLTADERRVAALADYARTASER
jgi:hypothetical protein